MSDGQEATSRREFLGWVARGAAAAGLVAGAGALAAAGKASHDCANAGLCRACPTYDDCILPQAQSARQAGMER